MTGKCLCGCGQPSPPWDDYAETCPNLASVQEAAARAVYQTSQDLPTWIAGDRSIVLCAAGHWWQAEFAEPGEGPCPQCPSPVDRLVISSWLED